METTQLKNGTVKKAIDALLAGDSVGWFALFTPQAEFYDDNCKADFKPFFEKALGHEYFTSIDKIKNNGLTIYGKFHSDRWGSFKTFFKFTLDEGGMISKLEIGQAYY